MKTQETSRLLRPKIHVMLFLVLIDMAFVLQVTRASEQDPPVCLSYEEAATRGLDVESIRAENSPAFEVDSNSCAFPNRGEQVEVAIEGFQREFIRTLAAETPVKGTVFSSLVFFDEDGKIKYFFYRCPDVETGEQICQIVRRIADDYTFPLKSTQPFYYCSTIRIPK